MEKIDFSSFNKPKYFPSWLCGGDTLKLAELSDKELSEIDENIRAIADQYDIDNASGAELDRIGKILGEDRGGNSDRIYRIYLKLRTMLNTADGTVEDIIKFVKFFFSSEVVHLVPNYPAGLRILHDGFNDTVDFNRIIKQIVGAGIAYDTRELFNMKEEFPIDESDEKRVHRVESEYFARNAVFHDGRVLRDGVTVKETHFVPLVRNGEERRNRAVERRNSLHRVKALGEINTPILRNSGLLDLLSLCFAKAFVDEFRAQTDEFAFDTVKQFFSERVEMREADKKKAVLCASDSVGRVYYRNGSIERNKKHRLLHPSALRSKEFDQCPDRHIPHDDGLVTVLHICGTEGTFSSRIFDEIGRKYKRNGKFLRNSSIFRSSYAIIDKKNMRFLVGENAEEKEEWQESDEFVCGRRFWFYRTGIYARNGGITRKSGVLEAL